MEEEFQIEEMVYQNSDEVVFQARELASQRLVAVRRFFLEDEALEKLQKKNADGRSLFSEGLDDLKSLEVPGLRQVLGGGFDELDGTPYVVTEWVDGQTLANCVEEGALPEGEGSVFEALARQTLVVLPEETRESVSLEAREVVLARGADGSLMSSLTISPRRYFGLMGGMNFPKVDRQQALLNLKSSFPAATGGSMSGITAGPSAPVVPQLASAQKGTGSGLLWASLAALVVIAGGAAFFVLTNKEEPTLADGTSQEGAPPLGSVEEPSVSAAEKPPSKPKALADLEETKLEEKLKREIASTNITDQSMRRATERTAQRVAEEKKKASSFVVPENKVEGEISADELFGSGPPAEESATAVSDPPEPQESVAQQEVSEPSSGWAPSAFLEVDSTFHTENLAKVIPTLKGANVLLEGVVTSIGKSGSDLHWYFYFTDSTGDSFRVVYRHAHDSQAKTFEDWEGYIGNTIRLKGEVVAFAGGSAIRLHNWLEIKQPSGPRTFQVSEVAKARTFLPAETEVSIEGTLIGFDKSGSAGYLLLQEESTVRGRFQMAGALGSSDEFRKGLVPMKGKKIRLRGVMQDDPAPSVETVIELQQPGCVELVAE